jgi:uncharacterized membrane protein
MIHHLLGHSEHSDAHANGSQEPAPLDILKRRFALGEISREQFAEMVRVLRAAEQGSDHAHYQERL